MGGQFHDCGNNQDGEDLILMECFFHIKFPLTFFQVEESRVDYFSKLQNFSSSCN
jgi:hypothetical protein